jgi:hypothetical protein
MLRKSLATWRLVKTFAKDHPPHQPSLLHHIADLCCAMEALAMALGASREMTMAGAALLGVLCHQTVMKPFEVDSRGWEMTVSYLSVLGGLFVGYTLSANYALGDALVRTASAGAAFLVGLYGSMLVYRAFFHRLGHFPGPFAARLSNLYQ